MRLGIAGCGKIVDDALNALADVPQIETAALFARPASREKANRLLKKYHRDEVQVVTDYDELLQDQTIDCIYIGLTNTAHYEFTKRALLSGKHVILEKPSVLRYEHLEDLIRCAEEQEVFLLEAFTTWHSDIFEQLQQLSAQLGRIRLVNANYSQYSSRYDAYKEGIVQPAFDPKLGGGCLFDIMIYNLSLMAGLFGRPDQVTYHPNLGFNGVDTSGIVHMDYPDFTACATAAKDCDGPGFFIVSGEKGYVKVSGAPNAFEAAEYCIEGETGSYEPPYRRHRMIREFIDFEQVISSHDTEAVKKWLEWSRITLDIALRAKA